MRKDYFKPVAITDTPVHGDFALCDQVATVLRVKNLRVYRWPAVVKCTDDEGFTEETGIVHTDEAYIRSYLHLFDSLSYDVEVVSWLNENDTCRAAFEQATVTVDRDMNYAYDGQLEEILPASTTEHYEFTLPNELVFPIPIDLSVPEFMALEKYADAYADMLHTLAWRQLLTTLPITDIHVVSNEPVEPVIDTPQTVIVTIEEVVSKDFAVSFKNNEDPVELAIAHYRSGEFVVDSGRVSFKQCAVTSPDSKVTEWTEF